MKDFNEFYNNDGSNPDIDAVPMNFDDEISESMWQFIISLDDVILESLTDDQIADYVEIIEAISDQPDDEKEDETAYVAEAMKVKTNKGEVSLNDNDSIEYEAKPGVVRIGMAGDVLSKGVKFKKKGTWYVVESAELDEAIPKKRVRRDILQKRKSSREHRKVKAKRKIEGRRKRKTAKFKRFKKKAKRLGKRGLTSTGKRKRTFINRG